MGGRNKLQRYWDISILTALKRNNLSASFILISFITIILISSLVPRGYQEFMFFFFGLPVIYAGLVYSLPTAIFLSVISFLAHFFVSLSFVMDTLQRGSMGEMLVEVVFIVVAYLFSCLFITKILLNERENQNKLKSLADLNARVAKELAQANKEISDIYTNTIRALAAAIDAKDPYTKGHSERVTKYAVQLAKAMKLSEKEIQNIFYGAILHDIGKIGINENILTKPGPLTNHEFQAIKRHPEIGATILNSVPFLEDVAPIVLYHHEYFNGQGYPKGLKGKEIPLGARIIAVVDAFDAITTDRPYRKGFSKGLAMADIRQGAGYQFDPELVEIFARIVEEYEPVQAFAEVASVVDG